MPRFLLILGVLMAPSAAFAQADTDMPKTMLGFLKSGMHLGVSSVEGTTSVILHTYTDEDYTVARELENQIGRTLKSAASVAETNPVVRKELDEYIERIGQPDESRSHLVIAPFLRTTFATVISVGDDYVLINLDGEQERKRVIPKASIGTIYVDANPIRFLNTSRRSSAANRDAF